MSVFQEQEARGLKSHHLKENINTMPENSPYSLDLMPNVPNMLQGPRREGKDQWLGPGGKVASGTSREEGNGEGNVSWTSLPPSPSPNLHFCK